jgi:uncharacterized protein (TIGR02301 family)
MLNLRRCSFALGAVLLVWAGPALGQDEAPEPSSEAVTATPPAGEEEVVGPPIPSDLVLPPVYDVQLLRLSEILGALAFLRQLCGEPDATGWRDEMSALLAAERPAAERRSRLIGRFNHGFETFNAVYRSCTPSARLAITRYLAEGKTLSNEVRSRYSQ